MDHQNVRFRALLVLGVSLILIPGCASSSAAPEKDLPDLLNEARKAYLKGVGSEPDKNTDQLKKARKLARKYVDRLPNGRSAPEAWYLFAQVEYQFGRYGNVVKAIDNGLQDVEDMNLKVAMLLLKGKANSNRENYENALRSFQQASDHVEGQPSEAARINLAELEYRRASMLVRNGRFEQARRVYNALLEDFPDTIFAEKTRDKLRFMTDYYSVQLGVFRQRTNALSLKQDLAREGMEAYLLTKDSKNGSLYSVRVGKFNEYGQAKQLAERLENQGYNVIVKP